MTRILVVDNYDSFVFTIVGYLEQLGAECEVVRNDAVAPADAAGFDGVLVSPGPGTPEEAGVSMAMIEACARAGAADARRLPRPPGARGGLGATVGRAPELLHGKTSRRAPRRQRGARRAAVPFTATRYHSLTIDPDTLPDSWSPPRTPSRASIMAVRHATLPLHGVQFHPESVLTEGGHRMLANWLVTVRRGRRRRSGPRA